MADFADITWVHRSRTQKTCLLTLGNLRWPASDGLPFGTAPGTLLAEKFTVQLPEEASGLWLDAHGTPFHFAAKNVSTLKGLPKLLKGEDRFKPCPSAFGLILKDDSKIVGKCDMMCH